MVHRGEGQVGSAEEGVGSPGEKLSLGSNGKSLKTCKKEKNVPLFVFPELLLATA